MRILADENFPRAAVELLRRAGHEVIWVVSEAPGISDHEVIAWAARDSLLLPTQDKDFGELAFRSRLPAACGIVLVRVFPPLPMKIAAAIERLFSSEANFSGEFVVIEEYRIRRRRLSS